jgi:hypothetical protein
LFRAELYIILNRPQDAEEHLDASMSLARKYSLAAYLNAADLMHGLVRVKNGEIEAGIQQSEAALETLKSVPSRRFHLPIRIGIVGLAKAGGGDRDGALAVNRRSNLTPYRRPILTPLSDVA